MGCDPSKQENTEIRSNYSSESDDEHNITYRQLIAQDRAKVFDIYHFSSIVSRSQYSIVRKVQSRNSQVRRICKIVPLTGKRSFESITEVQYLRKMDHPNAIKIFEYFLQPSFLFIITEDFEGSSILHQLYKYNKRIKFQDILEIMSQLLSVVEYCHKNQICHRAITVDNILLNWSNEMPMLKLIDFSQAHPIDCPKPKKIQSFKRTTQVRESELLMPNKIDIFDCGMVFYEMLTGRKNKDRRIWEHSEKFLAKISQLVKSLQLEPSVTKDLQNILKSMLDKNPAKRPSTSYLLQSQFFQKKNNQNQGCKTLQLLQNYRDSEIVNNVFQMFASLNMTSSIEKSEHINQFYNLDKNRDGQLQLKELIEGIINTFSITYQEAQKRAQKIFQELDRNKRGSISFSQYINGTMQLSKLFTKDFLAKMFHEMDIDNDGFVSDDELNNMLCGTHRLRILSNKKKVNIEEFKEIMMKIITHANQPRQNNEAASKENKLGFSKGGISIQQID